MVFCSYQAMPKTLHTDTCSWSDGIDLFQCHGQYRIHKRTPMWAFSALNQLLENILKRIHKNNATKHSLASPARQVTSHCGDVTAPTNDVTSSTSQQPSLPDLATGTGIHLAARLATDSGIDLAPATAQTAPSSESQDLIEGRRNGPTSANVSMTPNSHTDTNTTAQYTQTLLFPLSAVSGSCVA